MKKSDTDTEFEAKFYPVDKAQYRKKLMSIGAKLVIPERKMIRVIGDHRGNSVLAKNDYIRVRDEGDIIRLSLKIMADEGGKISDQKEVDVEVSDFNKTVRIIEAAGIRFNHKQESLREEWEYKNAQITIDTWPGLDPYSEIETDSEEKIREIAEVLGLDWDKKIITPAPEIWAKVYRMDIEKVIGMINNVTFENNPFEKLKRYPIAEEQKI